MASVKLASASRAVYSDRSPAGENTQKSLMPNKYTINVSPCTARASAKNLVGFRMNARPHLSGEGTPPRAIPHERDPAPQDGRPTRNSPRGHIVAHAEQHTGTGGDEHSP